jgi:pimeloyl-ACP methyl ester carboxylesterase
MIILRYWSVVETIIIAGIFALMIFWVVRSAKKREANPRIIPNTFGGRVGYFLLYVLRIVGFAVGTFLAVSLGVLVERNIYSAITETMPAPSEVNIPQNLPFKVDEVKFEGGDNLMMAGWRVPSQNGVTVILLHGYGGNRTAMLWHAKQLVGAGYGVLMYDERASGESEGTRRSYGWEDPRDVGGAIHFIETESGNGLERIGIAGCSIGGQIALQSTVLYPELEAVWADGPSALRAKDIPSPRNPIMALIILGNYSLDWVYEIGLGFDAPAPMIEMIGNIAPRQIMLVGGGQPQPFVGSESEAMIPRYAEYAGSNAQVWVIPEATHCDGPVRRPDEYAERMVNFFDTSFGITR